ncbi:hypothetical protein [Actinoplanes rectilineatus]|uniref:hypothetical protein n=1 Tax=Actinoplanes rectilineatus TaxID=113571 RepID=UPI0005F2EF0D|nr:hypothetical protein [Actinoplanes rectilineatus]
MDRRTLGRVLGWGLAAVAFAPALAPPAPAVAAPAVTAPAFAAPAVAAPAVAAPAFAAPAVVRQLRADPKWYQVQSAVGGKPEFLYGIAERFLGDGDRYLEIFELNKGRVQADGTALSDPAAITSGWILILPDDAEGEGVQTGPIPSAAPVAPVASANTSDASDISDSSDSAVTSSSVSGGLIAAIVAGVLVLAGAGAGVWWFLRRRRSAPSTSSSPDAVAAPSRTFDTAAAWSIDRALQVLVTSADAAGTTLPSIYGVSVDESRIALRLAAPDETPPEPWESADSGRVWQAQLRDLQALPASNDVAAPCPRLVTLGTAGGVRELIDLGQATGMISVQGDAAATKALVSSWTEELTSSPWAGGVQVVAGDIRPHLTGGERVSIRDALAAAEGEGSDTAFTLRGGGSANRKLGVLILGSTPGNRELERAQSLVNRPDAAWVVIVLGKTRYDRWRFTVDADGKLDTGALGITVYTGTTTPARSSR